MNKGLTIAFLGDIALNDNYIDHYLSNKNPFEKIAGILSEADYVVGNSEVTIKSEKGVNTLKQPTLFTREETLNYLKILNIDFVSLANNHIYDNLEDGFLKTVNFLSKNEIQFTGANLKNGVSEDKTTTIVEVNGKRIAFMGYVHPATNPSLPPDCEIEVNIYEQDQIISKINAVKSKVDYIILLLHWGLDNSSFPAPWQRSDARKFIEAGADLIIGHHAHVIQGYETINEKQVFYGLGNFCFSPFYVNNKKFDLDHRKHLKSIIVELDLLQSGKFKIHPIRNVNDWIIPGEKRITTKFTINSRLIPVISNKVVWPFYVFYLNVVYKLYFFFFGNKRNPLERLKSLNWRKIKRYLVNLKLTFSK